MCRSHERPVEGSDAMLALTKRSLVVETIERVFRGAFSIFPLNFIS